MQDFNISPHNARYRLEHWLTLDNKTLPGQLPSELAQWHCGPQLVSYIHYQHHHCQTTQPLLLEQLREWGIDISNGQISRLLLSGKDAIHEEKYTLSKAGLNASSDITVDDSGARHQARQATRHTSVMSILAVCLSYRRKPTICR